MNIETERLIIKPLTLDDARRFSEYRDKEEAAQKTFVRENCSTLYYKSNLPT